MRMCPESGDCDDVVTMSFQNGDIAGVYLLVN
jgi:hypothetical protein